LGNRKIITNSAMLVKTTFD